MTGFKSRVYFHNQSKEKKTYANLASLQKSARDLIGQIWIHDNTQLIEIHCESPSVIV